MAIEQDTLAVLKRIETLLKNQNTTTSTPASRKIAGGTTSEKSFKATSVALTGVEESANKLNKSFVGLNRTVLMTRANFVAMNKSMRASALKQLPSTVQAAVSPTNKPAAAASSLASTVTTRKKTAANNVLIKSSGALATTFASLGKAVGSVTTMLKDLTNDAFWLASRGLSASEGFSNLYVDAIKAGMSMREYTEALGNAMPSVLRADSFAAFDEQLSKSRADLAKMGIFGEEATRLSIGLANVTTTIGVSQKNLDSAVAGQNSVFAQLRKTTMMTARQFQALTQDLSENEDVQGNLLGLAQHERASRFQQIIQLQTLGLRLGATEKASRELGDALIAQRKSTLQQRFEAQGLTRQAGAAFGMDSGRTERLAMLNRKKNQTPEEALEFQRLSAELGKKLQTALNSGNVNQEFMAEQFLERINGTPLGNIMSASGKIELTKESGEIKAQERFGTGAGLLVEGAGKLLAYATGLSKNPVVSGGAELLGAVSGVVLTVLGGGLLGKLLKRAIPSLSRMGGPKGPSIPPGAKTPTPQTGRFSGLIGKAGTATVNGLKTAGGVVTNGLSALWNVVSKPSEILSRTANAAKNLGPLASKVMTSIQGGVKSISGVFSSLMGPLADTAKNLGPLASKVMTSIQGGVKSISGVFSSLMGPLADTAKKLGPLASRIMTSIQGGVKSISGVFSSLMGPLANAGKAAMSFGKTLLRGVGVLGGLFGAVGELFTGDLTSIFGDETSTLTDRIGNAIFGAINSIFGGVFDLVDSVIGIFSDDGLNLRSAFDKFSALMRGGFFSALASISKIFGSENKLSRYFEEASDNAFKVLDELRADSAGTYASLAEKQKQNLANSTKTSKESENTVSKINETVHKAAGIAYSTTGLAAQAVQDARSIAAQATPVTPAIKQVTVPKTSANEDNVSQEQQARKALNTASSSTAPDLSTVASLLQDAVTLLTTGNQIMEQQSNSLDSISRQATRPGSQDSMFMLNRLTNIA